MRQQIENELSDFSVIVACLAIQAEIVIDKSAKKVNIVFPLKTGREVKKTIAALRQRSFCYFDLINIYQQSTKVACLKI